MTPLEQFKTAYITCLLWTEELDYNYDETDFSNELKQQVNEDCEAFYNANKDIITGSESNAGIDFWLTRNGHGAGFWDGGWPEHGELLTKAAEAFKEAAIYVGDDGRLYYV